MMGRPSVCRYKMEMINSYITKYGLLNFDRFYYVYCKEFGNALSKIEPHPSYTFKKNKTDMLESVYIKIFSNMLSDVEKEVSETLSLDTDMEAVKTYAKMSGDLFQ